MSATGNPVASQGEAPLGGLSEGGGVKPKLAVIITCWNYADFVGRAIESVTSQNCPDCELVVVDDGSTDESWSVIRRHEASAYRIANRGQRAACAFGLERTSAPFILFLDADDELLPGSLNKIVKLLDPSVAKVQFPLRRINRNGAAIGRPFPRLTSWREREKVQRRIFDSGVYTTPPTSGNVFRRDLCALVAEADYDVAVDGVILFAAPFYGDIVSLREPLGLYRIHGRNDSGVGRAPDPVRLERDLQRYRLRIEHLNAVLAKKQVGRSIDWTSSIYVRKAQFISSIVEGRTEQVRDFLSLIRRYAVHDLPLTKRLLTMAYLTALYLAPKSVSRGILGVDRA